MQFFVCLLAAVSLFTMPVLAKAETSWIEELIEENLYRGEADNIPVTFVTLRNRTGSEDPGDYYGGSRGELSAGLATVSVTAIRGLDQLADSIPFYVPDEKIELTEIALTEVDHLLRSVKKFSKSDNGNVVTYVHGYNVGFEKGCKRAAIFQQALGLQDRLLFFSWPADGNMLKYTWDEADLGWSVPHMADFFEDLIRQTGKGNLDIVAHSLGARGAFKALVRMAYRENTRTVINQLVLIAPDIDAAVFHQDLHLLQKVAEHITIYVSDNDQALKLSHEVHGYPRLGESENGLGYDKGVDIIDISGISIRRASGHLYHLFNEEVIWDLIVLLHTGKKAEHRKGLERMEGGPKGRYILRSEE